MLLCGKVTRNVLKVWACSKTKMKLCQSTVFLLVERLLISSLLCPQWSIHRNAETCMMYPLIRKFILVSGPSLQCPRHTKWQGRKTCKSWFHQGVTISTFRIMVLCHSHSSKHQYIKCIYIAKKYLWPQALHQLYKSQWKCSTLQANTADIYENIYPN